MALGTGLVAIAIASDGFGAPAGVVAVIRPPESGPMTTEVVTRVRGELVAAGFQVALVDHVSGSDPGAEIRQVASKLRPLAIFGIFEQGEGGADIWVADLMTGRTLVERIGADAQDRAFAKDGSSVQAVRAVELLRASLLELVVERSNLANASRPPERDAAPETPTRVCPCDAAGATRSGPLGFEAGAALLHSFEGIGPSVSPIIRASYRPWSRFALRVAASGLGTRPLIERDVGQARVAQQLVLFELAAIFDADRVLAPTLSIGAGAYHLEAEGSAPSPYVATTQELWAAAFDAGGGGRLALGRHFALSLEVHALLTSAYPTVRIAQNEAGRAGRPSVLGSLTLAATP